MLGGYVIDSPSEANIPLIPQSPIDQPASCDTGTHLGGVDFTRPKALFSYTATNKASSDKIKSDAPQAVIIGRKPVEQLTDRDTNWGKSNRLICGPWI